MGRRAIDVGTLGPVNPVNPKEWNEKNPDKPRRKLWQAVVRWRDREGGYHQMYAEGESRTAVETMVAARWADIVEKMDAEDAERAPAKRTISDLYEAWIRAVTRPKDKSETLRSGTLDQYAATWRTQLGPAVGHLVLDDVTPAELLAALEGLVVRERGKVDEDGVYKLGDPLLDEDGWQVPVRGRQPRAVLHMMLQYAVDAGLRADSRNPLAETKPRKRKKTKPRALTVEEADRLIEMSLTSPKGRRANGDLHDVLVLLRYTGCRIGEVLGLTWSRVHLDEAAPWVLVDRQLLERDMTLGPTKGGDTRRILLHPTAAAMLRERRDAARARVVRGVPRQWTHAAHPVFAVPETKVGEGQTGRPAWLRHSNVRASLRAIVKGTDLEWVHPHTFRATLATMADRRHGSGAAADLLGHTTDDVTKRHYIEEDDHVMLDPRDLFGGEEPPRRLRAV